LNAINQNKKRNKQMDTVEQSTQTPPQNDERPRTSQLLEGADYLREKAKSNLDTIKTALNELKAQRPDGKLTEDDIRGIKELLEQRVELHVAEAAKMDNERLAIAAGGVAEKAFITDKFRVALTPSEVADAQAGNLAVKK
jgi:hypothetical protein